MARVVADHADTAVATNHPALLTHLLDARSDLHWGLLSLVPVGDTTSGEVVGGEFHLNLVAREDTDVVHPHLAGDMGKNLVPVLQLDAKHRVRERLEDRSFKDDRIFFRFRQGESPCSAGLSRIMDMGRQTMLSAGCGNANGRREPIGSAAALHHLGKSFEHVVGMTDPIHDDELSARTVVLDEWCCL